MTTGPGYLQMVLKKGETKRREEVKKVKKEETERRKEMKKETERSEELKREGKTEKSQEVIVIIIQIIQVGEFFIINGSAGSYSSNSSSSDKAMASSTA